MAVPGIQAARASRIAELQDAVRRASQNIGSSAETALGADIPRPVPAALPSAPGRGLFVPKTVGTVPDAQSIARLAEKARLTPDELTVEEALVLLRGGADPNLIFQGPATPEQVAAIMRKVDNGIDLSPEEVAALKRTPVEEAPAFGSAVSEPAPPVAPAGAVPVVIEKHGNKFVAVDETGAVVSSASPAGKGTYRLDDGRVVDATGELQSFEAPGDLTSVGGGEVDNLANSATQLGEGAPNLTRKKLRPDTEQLLADRIRQATTVDLNDPTAPKEYRRLQRMVDQLSPEDRQKLAGLIGKDGNDRLTSLASLAQEAVADPNLKAAETIGNAADQSGAKRPLFVTESGLPDQALPTAYDEAVANAAAARDARQLHPVGAELPANAPEDLPSWLRNHRMEDRTVAERLPDTRDVNAVEEALRIQESLNAAKLRLESASGIEAFRDAVRKRNEAISAAQQTRGRTNARIAAMKLVDEAEANIAQVLDANPEVKSAFEDVYAATSQMEGLYKPRIIDERTGKVVTKGQGIPEDSFVEYGRRPMPDKYLNRGSPQDTWDDIIAGMVGHKPRGELRRTTQSLSNADTQALTQDALDAFGDDARGLVPEFDPDWTPEASDLQTNQTGKPSRLGGSAQQSRIEGSFQRAFQGTDPLGIIGNDGKPVFTSGEQVARYILDAKNTRFRPGTADYEMAVDRIARLVEARHKGAVPVAAKPAAAAKATDAPPVVDKPVDEPPSVTENLDASATELTESPAVEGTTQPPAKKRGGRKKAEPTGGKAPAAADAAAAPAASDPVASPPVVGATPQPAPAAASATPAPSPKVNSPSPSKSWTAVTDADKAAEAQAKNGAARVYSEVLAQEKEAGATPNEARNTARAAQQRHMDNFYNSRSSQADASPPVEGDTPAAAASSTPDTASPKVDGDTPAADKPKNPADSPEVEGRDYADDAGPDAPDKPADASPTPPKKDRTWGEFMKGKKKYVVGGTLIGGGLIAAGNLNGPPVEGWQIPGGAGGPGGPGGPSFDPLPIGRDGGSLMEDAEAAAAAAEEARMQRALDRIRKSRPYNATSQIIQNYHMGVR